MSLYPPPKRHNGFLNTVFNQDDYTQNTDSSTGTTQLQNDSRYLRNTGVVVSSGATIFNNTVDINGGATLTKLEVSSLFKAKKSADDFIISIFTALQRYSFFSCIYFRYQFDYNDRYSYNSTTIIQIYIHFKTKCSFWCF
ncbi:MAG: hypothetical protein H7196_05215 [candidate division SR1 bacterium]|nr:hypothetical protein [candidate division SR1 bacterium]